VKTIAKFQYITQNSALSHWLLAENVCAGGCKWVQLRVKNESFENYLTIANETKKVCDKFQATLIINDNVLIAKEIKAHGVHLGKNDMSPKEARKILGNEAIIGGTANTFQNILHLVEQGVDYVGLGPFRFTKTKENLSEILGLNGYKSIINQCNEAGIKIPIIAIGGIELSDVNDLKNTGIHGIAVASCVTFAENISLKTKDFLKSV